MQDGPTRRHLVAGQEGKALRVASISDGDVHSATGVDGVVIHGVRPLVSVDVAVVEDVHSVLIRQGLHGHAHLLKLLVAGVSCVPASKRTTSCTTP